MYFMHYFCVGEQPKDITEIQRRGKLSLLPFCTTRTVRNIFHLTISYTINRMKIHTCLLQPFHLVASYKSVFILHYILRVSMNYKDTFAKQQLTVTT